MTQTKKNGTRKRAAGNGSRSDSDGAPASNHELSVPLRDLQHHLHRYGLRYFADGGYYDDWTSSRLKSANARRYGTLMARCHADPTRENLDEVTNFSVQDNVFPLLHSQQTGTIGAAGEYISKQLAGRMNILDVGCDAGYLTTWYAHLDPQRTVLGIDSSKQAIALARRFADKFGITNVDFRNQDVTKNDLGGPYDAIVESFVLNGDFWDLPAIFQALRSALATGGVFIFVERLRNQERVDQFVESLGKGGFQTFLDHGFVAATDCGERERFFSGVASPLAVSQVGGQLLMPG